MAADAARLRGADDLKDLFWDLRFIKRDFPGGGRVHRGFFAAYDKVRAPLLDELGGLVTRVPIIVTGHSLGAAMAQIPAAELCSLLLENCGQRPTASRSAAPLGLLLAPSRRFPQDGQETAVAAARLDPAEDTVWVRSVGFGRGLCPSDGAVGIHGGEVEAGLPF